MYQFPDSARVVFVGDSITAANNYTSHIMAYYLENSKDKKVSFFNSSVPGGTTVSQLEYLYDQAMKYSPTHAVVTIGVNDSRFFLLENQRSTERYNDLAFWYESYKKTLPALCDELEKNGVSIILCTPPPYAEYQPCGNAPLNGAYALVAEYAEFCRSLAAERGYPLCDFHGYMTEKMQTEILFDDDRVHPNDRGHYYMAKCFLSHQGFEIGEQKPIPEYLRELNSVAADISHIFFVERHAIEDYNLPVQEKLLIIKDYVENKKYPAELYGQLAEKYLKIKLQQDFLTERVIELTKNIFG